MKHEDYPFAVYKFHKLKADGLLTKCGQYKTMDSALQALIGHVKQRAVSGIPYRYTILPNQPERTIFLKPGEVRDNLLKHAR